MGICVNALLEYLHPLNKKSVDPLALRGESYCAVLHASAATYSRLHSGVLGYCCKIKI